jgi:hypothetical protein
VISGFFMVSNWAKNLWVRVVKPGMDPFSKETYQSQACPSRQVGNSRHNTTSGYPNSLMRFLKLTINAIGSLNLDCRAPKVPTLERSECGGQVNA